MTFWDSSSSTLSPFKNCTIQFWSFEQIWLKVEASWSSSRSPEQHSRSMFEVVLSAVATAAGFCHYRFFVCFARLWTPVISVKHACLLMRIPKTTRRRPFMFVYTSGFPEINTFIKRFSSKMKLNWCLNIFYGFCNFFWATKYPFLKKNRVKKFWNDRNCTYIFKAFEDELKLFFFKNS